MKKSLAESGCPVARGYSDIGDGWSLLILTQIILLRRRRFGQIREELGVAKNILTTRLNKLVAHGILERVPLAEGGARQEYAPTPKGEDLHTVLVALMQWGQAHFFDDEPCARSLIDRATGDPVARIALHTTNGRPLTLPDLEVVYGAEPA